MESRGGLHGRRAGERQRVFANPPGRGSVRNGTVVADWNPVVESPRNGTPAWNPVVGSRRNGIPARNPVVGSRRNGIPSRNPVVGSRKNGTPARNPVVASRKNGTPARNPVVGSRRNGTPARNPVVGSWKNGTLGAANLVPTEKNPIFPEKTIARCRRNVPSGCLAVCAAHLRPRHHLRWRSDSLRSAPKPAPAPNPKANPVVPLADSNMEKRSDIAAHHSTAPAKRVSRIY